MCTRGQIYPEKYLLQTVLWSIGLLPDCYLYKVSRNDLFCFSKTALGLAAGKDSTQQTQKNINEGSCRLSVVWSASHVRAKPLAVQCVLSPCNTSLHAATISGCWQVKYNTHKSPGSLMQQAAADQLLCRPSVSHCWRLLAAQGQGTTRIHGIWRLIPQTAVLFTPQSVWLH